MALLATLQDYRRSEERRSTDADVTLRIDGRPLDALIANISVSGCLFVCAAPLEVGDAATIGIAGIGRRSARIVRAAGTRFGATFDTPLTPSEIEAAVAMPNETVVSLSLPITGLLINADEPSATRLPAAARLVITITLTAATWAVLAALPLAFR